MIAKTATARGPSNPAGRAAATVTAPSPAPVAQAARRWPSRHSRRQAKARGRPHGTTGARDDTAASVSGPKRTMAVAATPAGSHNSARIQNPGRPIPDSRVMASPPPVRLKV